KGLVVTAGFWNNHVHLLTPALLDARDSRATGLQQELDALFNRWGFTTVFDLGSVLDNTLALKHRIESGELRGPRVLTTGEPIWTMEPVYIRDFLETHHLSFPNSTTSDQALALVRDHVAKGANGIKLFTGSYQGNGKVAALPLPIARAAVTEAHRHRHGLPAFAHPQDGNGVNIAVDSGVDILAHTVPQSPAWDQAYVQRLRRANLALIPTLTLFDVEARKDGASDTERDAWIARMVDELRAYSKAGGDILFGTDVGYTDHYETGLEFILMSRAEMTYRDVLASLTTTPAGRFGDANRRGRIEKGMEGDLVVLRADPAGDPGAFAKVGYTIRQGVVTYRAP
ncbi:MAG TPA: amidohydrolase family protein, partial [Vicinamibacterales bacterium]|nr:amidohydrolase family protein [Vicinamibacterales bacterium]